MAFRLNRRTLLKGLLGGAAVGVALPTLEIFLNSNGTAYADGSSFPRRFGLFFWGNGVIPENWIPAQTGDQWALSEQLEPLAPVKDQLTVVSGMRVQTGNSLAHMAGAAGILSGMPLSVSNGDNWTFSGPSIDQMLATRIGGFTRFRSLEIAAEEGASGHSWAGVDSRNPPEWSPIALYQRLFGGGFVEPGDEPIIDPKLGLRRSVLDLVMDDSKKLRAKVGAADKVRLDQHFSAIRDMENRLAILENNPPTLASCRKPDEPMEAYPPIDGRPQLAEINAVMSEMLAMALACDQTRVFSYWFSDSVSNVLYPGIDAGHHRLTHDEPGEQPKVNEIVKFIMTQFSTLLQKLQSVQEGDGTLLDNCAILGTTDCSFARQHSLEEYPILIAGGGCGSLKRNTHYRSVGNENASKVLMSLMRAAGAPVAELGAEGGLVSEGLTEIEL